MVVDNSAPGACDPDVPLVVSEVNPEALDGHQGIVANPNCSTMQMVVALKPIHDAAGIERLVVSTYQSVSGTGRRRSRSSTSQAHARRCDGAELPAPQVYRAPDRVQRRCRGAGNFADGDDYTDEERKMMYETRKILGDESIAISATCVRVPVYTAHSESVNVQTREPLGAESARELLEPRPADRGRRPGDRRYPMALDAAGRDDVLRRPHPPRPVARARPATCGSSRDNLRKGAATNAVQLAELLHARGLVGTRAAA